MIDLRDLVYYLSLTGIFLALNVALAGQQALEPGRRPRAYRRGMALTSALLIANLLLVNVWLYPLSGLRARPDRAAASTASRAPPRPAGRACRSR